VSTTSTAIATCSAAASRWRTPPTTPALRRAADAAHRPRRRRVGVTAAWYLASDGHEVTGRRAPAGRALETSFANGGQISASYAEPWANPERRLKILKWLGQDDAPLLFRLRARLAAVAWGLSS
jgi:hypothetical protein